MGLSAVLVLQLRRVDCVSKNRLLLLATIGLNLRMFLVTALLSQDRLPIRTLSKRLSLGLLLGALAGGLQDVRKINAQKSPTHNRRG